jgi:hypothetical protein
MCATVIVISAGGESGEERGLFLMANDVRTLVAARGKDLLLLPDLRLSAYGY